MRNQLLNFRPRTLVIKVVDEIPTEIYDILVLQDKKMEFLPIDDEDENNNISTENDKSENTLLTIDESELLWKLPPPDMEVDDRHNDLFLQTNYPSKNFRNDYLKLIKKQNLFLKNKVMLFHI